jgi:hypothetical protein
MNINKNIGILNALIRLRLILFFLGVLPNGEVHGGLLFIYRFAEQ